MKLIIGQYLEIFTFSFEKYRFLGMKPASPGKDWMFEKYIY